MSSGVVFLVLCAAAIVLIGAAGGIGLVLTHQARLASEGQHPVVWFRYLRAGSWMMPACMIVWAGLWVSLFEGVTKYAFYDSESVWPALFMIVLLLAPPPLASMAFQLASRRLLHILRGVDWTTREVVAQWFWALTSFWIPAMLAGFALLLAVDGELRIAAAMVGLAALLFFLSSGRRNASCGLEVRALDCGELRDRSIELARKAKVRLRSVMIIRSIRGPVMNGFAATGGNIILAEDLVRAMPREELDAIIAHELGHLRYHHPVLVLVAAIVPVFLLSWLLGLVPVAFVAKHKLLLALPGAVLLGGILTRRMEHAADRAASRLIEDAEISIRALARLTHLNMLPARWTGWDVKALSHPSLEERCACIAERFRIPASRVIELLRAEGNAAETYRFPAALETSEWVAYRQQSGVPALAIYLACVVIPPISGTYVMTKVPAIPLWIAVGVLTFFIAHVIPLRAARSRLRALERRIRARTGASGGVFVGLRPAREPRVYEWHPYWDVGIAEFNGLELRYSGEQTAFGVNTAHVEAVTPTESSPGWFQLKAISFQTCYGPFSFIPMERSAGRRLLQDAQAWLAAGDTAAGMVLSPPAFPQISSVSPREAALSSAMFTVLVLVGLSSLAATSMLAPQWTAMPAAISIGVTVAELLPSIVYRES